MANFFERQEKARRNTTQLVLIYGLTVLLLILGFYTTVVFLVEDTVVFRPWLLGSVAGAILIGIGVTRTNRLAELRQGGRIVARSLNAQRLDPSQATGERQQLLNVVEEMAIAANVPAPSVYVLPDRSINAFSAGFGQEDAVIGVTQGALQQLDRDELQAVVAHEFSHILNA
ncbi:MAG: M48 family metalloprotease [Salinibacter sp.]